MPDAYRKTIKDTAVRTRFGRVASGLAWLLAPSGRTGARAAVRVPRRRPRRCPHSFELDFEYYALLASERQGAKAS